MAIKILIGGSPCTFWSIAQKNGREVEAKGTGWELFKNYLIAKEKFKPDFFLYENNKSAAKAIKDQISKELDVPLMYINSALVSAQTRQRFYAFNWEVEQPEDRGISLCDILESGEDLTSNEKAYCLTATYDGAVAWNTIERAHRSMVAEQVRIPEYGASNKSRPVLASYAGKGTSEGSVKAEAFPDNPSKQVFDYIAEPMVVKEATKLGYTEILRGTVDRPLYEVADGMIAIRGKKYPVKLKDGYYYIRKYTPIECERLQTLPDGYTKAVSNTQRYKGIGNGWTAEVIIHILNGALKNVPRDEKIIVLSMYDGIGIGRYCLDKMGFTNVEYHAYEIDKYPIKVAMDNYPDIIQHGDAFAVRDDDWQLIGEEEKVGVAV